MKKINKIKKKDGVFMKKLVWMSFVLYFSMLIIPFSVLGNGTGKAVETIKPITVGGEENDSKNEESKLNEDYFRVYNHETKKVVEMSSTDYIFGVVAAEMPALYESEALKAQAVAAYTYACYNRNNNSNKEYDVSTDFNTSQSFIAEDDVDEKWGSKTEEYKEKIKKAIRDTNGYVIKYNDEIILSVYHAISSGRTEDCKNVWGKEYPYLKSVDCSFDKNAENYSTKVEFTNKQKKEKLGDIVNEKTSPEDYFGDISLSKTGLVKEIQICNKNYKGSEIREALELRSSNFDVEYKNKKFTFTVYGYGHGVGMSQFGANELAKQGKDFKEILEYFYTDCSVEK